MRGNLEKLARVLALHGEEQFSETVRGAAEGTDEEIKAFVVSNELWGGAGSIADQAGIGNDRTDGKRQIEAALIDLGNEQIEKGIVNCRTVTWVNVFKEWRTNGV